MEKINLDDYPGAREWLEMLAKAEGTGQPAGSAKGVFKYLDSNGATITKSLMDKMCEHQQSKLDQRIQELFLLGRAAFEMPRLCGKETFINEITATETAIRQSQWEEYLRKEEERINGSCVVCGTHIEKDIRQYSRICGRCGYVYRLMAEQQLRDRPYIFEINKESLSEEALEHVADAINKGEKENE